MDKDTKNLLLQGVLIAGGVFIVYKLIKGLGDINKDTPYEGYGVIGTAGNITNQILGNAPQKAGDIISNLFATSIDPNEPTSWVYFPDGGKHLVYSKYISTHFFGPDTLTLPAMYAAQLTWAKPYAGREMKLSSSNAVGERSATW